MKQPHMANLLSNFLFWIEHPCRDPDEKICYRQARGELVGHIAHTINRVERPPVIRDDATKAQEQNWLKEFRTIYLGILKYPDKRIIDLARACLGGGAIGSHDQDVPEHSTDEGSHPDGAMGQRDSARAEADRDAILVD